MRDTEKTETTEAIFEILERFIETGKVFLCSLNIFERVTVCLKNSKFSLLRKYVY